ncbi:MAG: hypothetical protein COW03_06860 [Cytophagales bacterium CG12_big_fil_rev_8_21_14_0_65_40_12]|nr:MAG: hypothetical protein COW03_06860 [Cytophagales bacterium CG12_big_fil_rev_8_21_14_0_65_40_12]PIW02835.1 MAG: hypothetical protein COW40_17780 [Cytophagales bacterium CG17_big_fil_post_rev_8_21_14_2_50_40_13]
MKNILFLLMIFVAASSCQEKDQNTEFTGNEIEFQMIPGTVDGNTTTGTLVIKERTDGRAQIEVTVNDVLQNAEHPVHLHFGSLEDNGVVATYLTTLKEEDGVGKSLTILDRLDDNTMINFSQLSQFNGSIKIHFEASGPMENEILVSTNIGLNAPDNAAYLNGSKSITVCNNDFKN